jgi:hypothetical protein
MVDYDKLHYTPIYNWTILPTTDGKEVYTLYCKTFGDWAVFSYHKTENKIVILQSVTMYCGSFERANELVYDTLIVHRWQIHTRYLGRYFKLKKMLGQEIEHDVMEHY